MPVKSRRQPVASDRRFRKQNSLSDYGTPERWQHTGRILVLTEKAGILAAQATEEHIVDIMVTRGLLTASQSEAAFKFKSDFHRANLGVRVTSRYSPAGSSKDFFRPAPERTDLEEAAYQRWRNAVRELGLGLSNIVITTVCHDKLPMPRNIAMLQEGLEKLVDWYRLPKNG
jgi:hypothetical protein